MGQGRWRAKKARGMIVFVEKIWAVGWRGNGCVELASPQLSVASVTRNTWRNPQWVESVKVLRRNGFCHFVMMTWCWRGPSLVSLSTICSHLMWSCGSQVSYLNNFVFL